MYDEFSLTHPMLLYLPHLSIENYHHFAPHWKFINLFSWGGLFDACEDKSDGSNFKFLGEVRCCFVKGEGLKDKGEWLRLEV